ncbi:sortase [Patescibacteria group bacterium]|nr:sortase [Patescibacteria group bacterium]
MKKKLLSRIFAGVLGIFGLAILIAIIVPLANYQRISSQKYPKLLSPIPDKGGSTLGEESDLTKASNWFVGGAKSGDFTSSSVSFYTISIPKLKIDSASVAFGGEDLSKSLIHYPGTALPGQKGNAVIFGHSVLPLFFDPKDYLKIFSTLPSLNKGDEILVNYDGVSYKYRVETMQEILPTDLQVLDQDKSDSFLTLVTCVPPGDPRKPFRLIVRARIVPLAQTNANTWN